MRKILRLVFVLALVAAGGWYYVVQSRPVALVLTGIVTGHDVVIAPQIAGRLAALHAREGDTVTAGQLLAEIEPGELEADRDYYTHTPRGSPPRCRSRKPRCATSAGSCRIRRRRPRPPLPRPWPRTPPRWPMPSAPSSRSTARATSPPVGWHRRSNWTKSRTSYAAAQARVDSLARQVDAQRAALSLVRASVEQVSMRRSQVQTSEAQLAAVGAQGQKAEVRLKFAHSSPRSTASWTCSRRGWAKW